MKNYLITGGCGFVGSHLAETLIKMGHNVSILDNLSTGKINNIKKIFNKIELIKGDIRDTNVINENSRNKDGIFHFAAKASVPESFQNKNEYFDVNVTGTKNIFDAGVKQNIKIVYASSSSVYGNQSIIPIKETSRYNPINPYAETKVECEKLARKYFKKNLDVVGLRFFNIFGERQSLEYAGVITKFLEKIKNKKSPIIFGNGSQIRDFIFVGDIVNANIEVMKSNVTQDFFNVGTGKKISILELANLIIKISKLNLKPEFYKPLPGDIQESVANTELIRKRISWSPNVTLSEWLESIMN